MSADTARTDESAGEERRTRAAGSPSRRERLTCFCVIGTRPEAIKMAPVIMELQKHAGAIRTVVCSTGQHREMLDQALHLFNIAPDIELNVMQPDQKLSELTSVLLTALDTVLERVRPDCILAQGDTTTVLASALAAYYRRVPFGHVEAGLRTGDRFQPFPEEMNRSIADTLSEWLFAPTEQNRQNLLREGCPDGRIVVTGNTVIDALHYVAALPYDWASGVLADLAARQQIVLITAHRRENFGERFRQICEAIRELAGRFPGVQFVYPVHLNPNVRKPVLEMLAGLPNVILTEPLDYKSLVHLMKRSMLILTDSGGIQEEAPGLGIPVLVMREKTERPEGVETGVVRLTGTARDSIVQEVEQLLTDAAALASMAKAVNPYGDGHAAERIVQTLLSRMA